MLRHSDDPYKNGRSSQLIKCKNFIDVACKVIDIISLENAPKQGMAVCLTPDGKEFKASLKMSHAEREAVLTNKENYIGLTAEIRFQEYTDEGLPRIGVLEGFRLDK